MTWLQRYRVRHFLRNSIWFAPVIGMAIALAFVRILLWIDRATGWEANLNVDAARAVLGTLAASMFTFIVFISSALLIVVQIASAQLTPRVIGIVFRDPVTRLSLTMFVFTFTLTLAVLIRIETSVPLFTAELTAYSCLASLGIFLYLIDHVGKSLRPSGTLRIVGRLGREVIENVYPREYAAGAEAPASEHEPEGCGPTTIVSPGDGAVLAFDIRGLIALAERAKCVIEMVPQVGDAVAEGAPLFQVYGDSSAVSRRQLLHCVALGQERTVEQDATFTFRILVDIANKGLSPAINDPTTAVLAIDQIHGLLRLVGMRRLDEGIVRDAAGNLRLIYRTPDWEDFVHLAVTEIRQFGGQSIQIARRLRAMLEDLIQTLPEKRALTLRHELNVLHDASQRLYLDPNDRALADISDSQGVGGAHRLSYRSGAAGTGSSAILPPRSNPD